MGESLTFISLFGPERKQRQPRFGPGKSSRGRLDPMPYHKPANTRSNRIFTSDEKIIIRSVATANNTPMQQGIDTIVDLLTK
jgi:hypothetical protein